MKRLPNDPNDVDKFHPTFSNDHGANWFDTRTNILYVLLKGDMEIIIKTKDVILVSREISISF